MNLLNITDTNLMVCIGVIIVVWTAINRFNKPPPVLVEEPVVGSRLKPQFKKMFRWKAQLQQPLFRPLRANTTAFRYRLSQIAYALLFLVVYLVLLRVEIALDQIKQIIDFFWPGKDSFNLPEETGSLFLSVFVVVILPLIPPFRWADISIRKSLYTRARIPAQQRREMSRLKQAYFKPPQEVMDAVCKHFKVQGFLMEDFIYEPDYPTAQMLWYKCAILIEEIEAWEADDHYKTAFAVLYEPEVNKRSVDIVHSGYDNLISNAKTYFKTRQNPSEEEPEALRNRESRFREECKELLGKIYGLLSRVSLHAHYSDRDRVEKFGKLGFLLKEDQSGPVPDPNELAILSLILALLFVGPLAQFLTMGKAIMIGCIMFSAVLIPILLAAVCPGIVKRRSFRNTPNVLYPVVSAIIAMLFSMIIMLIGSFFITTRLPCGTESWMWYRNCTYPWSLLHGGISFLLAWRLRSGIYPKVLELDGLNRIRKWGNPLDALICATGMILIAVLLVVPLLKGLPIPNVFEGPKLLRMVLLIGLISSALGFIVPTWYRANQARGTGDNKSAAPP